MVMALLVLSSCTTTPQDNKAANALVNELHSHWQAQQWDEMLTLLDDGLLTQSGVKGWRNTFSSYHASLGSLQTMMMKSSQIDARYSGDFYMYSYRLHFERGDVREMVTVYKPLQGDGLKIVGLSLNK